MSRTTKEYINGIDFTYFETYSFQRKGEYGILHQLTEKSIHGGSLKCLEPDERVTYDLLKNSVGNLIYSNRILDQTKKLHDSAELVAIVPATISAATRLIEILHTPIEEELHFMCAPVYRDAILFYNAEEAVVEGINICFECDRIETINKEYIHTDYKAFKYLKQLLLTLGHTIENPDYFKADNIMQMAAQSRQKQKAWEDWRKRRAGK